MNLVETGIRTNAILATVRKNSNFGAHYTNLDENVFGLEQLISAIMRDNGSVFARGAHEGGLRDIVIASSMFADEILDRIQVINGCNRYPMDSLRVYLAKRGKNFCKIQLTNAEDSDRLCKRPRVKYYLAD